MLIKNIVFVEQDVYRQLLYYYYYTCTIDVVQVGQSHI